MEIELVEFEIWVDSKVLQSEQKIMNQFITPIQKETDGIRSEIRMLAETMKHGNTVFFSAEITVGCIVSGIGAFCKSNSLDKVIICRIALVYRIQKSIFL